MQFSGQDTISIIGALQGMLLSIVLFTRSRNRRAYLILGLFTLIFSVGLLDRFNSRVFPDEGPLRLIPDFLGGLVFLYGPLFYLYVRYLLLLPATRREWSAHLGLFFAYTILLFGLLFYEILGGTADQPEEGSGLLDYVLVNLLFLQLFFYCYLTLRLIYRQEGNYSKGTPGHSAIRWIKGLFLLLTIVYVLSYLGLHLTILGIPVGQPLYTVVQVGSVVLIYLLSYRALMQPDMAVEKSQEEAREKYQTSPLNEADKDKYLRQLLDFIETEKPFLNPKLTIDQLAQELGFNRFYLSQVINERLNKNFSDFINSYRIRETQRLMGSPDHQHLNILGMAYESGFNSKSSFNAAFKKVTGMSPSEYRRSVRQKGAD